MGLYPCWYVCPSKRYRSIAYQIGSAVVAIVFKYAAGSTAVSSVGYCKGISCGCQTCLSHYYRSRCYRAVAAIQVFAKFVTYFISTRTCSCWYRNPTVCMGLYPCWYVCPSKRYRSIAYQIGSAVVAIVFKYAAGSTAVSSVGYCKGISCGCQTCLSHYKGNCSCRAVSTIQLFANAVSEGISACGCACRYGNRTICISLYTRWYIRPRKRYRAGAWVHISVERIVCQYTTCCSSISTIRYAERSTFIFMRYDERNSYSYSYGSCRTVAAI